MTTTPVPAPPRPTQPPPDTRPDIQPLTRGRPDPRAKLIRLVVVLGSFVILVAGWRVVGIDIPKLIMGLPAAQHILVGLVTPDLVKRETVTTELQAPFVVGTASDQPSVASDRGATFTITPGGVTGGQEVTFAGTGLAPNAPGTLTLDISAAGRGQKISDIETDALGEFILTFEWPARIAAGEYRVTLVTNAPTGRILPSDVLMLSLSRMVETILLALMGTVFGVLISVPLSFLGARNLMQGSALGMAIYYVVRTIFNIGRAIEVLILAVIMAVVVGIGPFAGMMAIVLHSIGAMGKLYSEAIESIDSGPIEAVTATGANRFQTVVFAVVPQVVPQFLSFTMYRWDINVRMSTVVGLVGGGGIGFLLIQYINLLQWSQAATALWLIAITVMVMDYASAAARARLV
jgi:phosphonate transport system permease protein